MRVAKSLTRRGFVDLRYAGKTVMFIPAVENTAKADGLRDQVANWIDSILRVATLFHRLDDHAGVYLRDIHQAPEVQVCWVTNQLGCAAPPWAMAAAHSRAALCPRRCLWPRLTPTCSWWSGVLWS